MIQLGSQNKPYTIAVDGGNVQTFTSANQALDFANQSLAQGHKISVGLMQIPNDWFQQYHVTVADVLLPCKNTVIATQILDSATSQCMDMQSKDPNVNLTSCALSIYKSGDPQSGMDYANKIMDYAKSHNFDDMVAKAKAKNPKEFSMLPGDAATTIATPNAAQINPATDPKRLIPHEDDSASDNGNFQENIVNGNVVDKGFSANSNDNGSDNSTANNASASNTDTNANTNNQNTNSDISSSSTDNSASNTDSTTNQW